MVGTALGAGPAGGIIDLGDLSWGGEVDIDQLPAPEWTRHVPAVLVVLAFALTTVSSAVFFPPPLSHPLWSSGLARSHELTLGRDVLYAMEYRSTAALTAYGAESGEQLWRREFSANQLRVIDLGDTVLVQSRSNVTFLSARTGAVVHQSPGPADYYVGTAGADLHIVAGMVADPARCAAGPSAYCLELRAFSLDGPGPDQPRWQLQTRAGAAYDVQYASDRDGRGVPAVAGLKIVEGDRIRFIAPEDGRETAAMVNPAGISEYLAAIDRLVTLAYDRDADGVVLSARAAGWTSWRVDLPGPAPSSTPRGASSYVPADRLEACDGLLCVSTATGLTLVDPVAGRVLLSTSDRATAAINDDLRLTWTDPDRFNQERYYPHAYRPDPYLMATPTQVRLWRMPEASLVAQHLAVPVRWYDSSGRGLLTREGAQATELLLIEPSGAISLLGTLAERGGRCTAYGDLLACAVGPTLQVFRLPPAPSGSGGRAASPEAVRDAAS